MFNESVLGPRLRELRKSKKLSLQEVADSIGSIKGTIGNIERGTKPASLAMVMSLAEFFDVSLDYLMGATDLPRPIPPYIQKIINQANDLSQLIEALDRVSLANKEITTGREYSPIRSKIEEMLEGLDEDSMEELRRYIGYLRARQTLDPDKDESSAGLDTGKRRYKRLNK